MLSKERTKYKNLFKRRNEKIEQKVNLEIKKARQELEREKNLLKKSYGTVNTTICGKTEIRPTSLL